MNLMKSAVSNFLMTKMTIVILLAAGLFVFATPQEAVAQSSSLLAFDFYKAPDIQYVGESTAITRTNAEVLSFKALLDVLTPGSSSYNEAYVQYELYTVILDNLISGKQTKQSLEAGLQIFSSDLYSALSRTQRMEYRQEAIDLLKL